MTRSINIEWTTKWEDEIRKEDHESYASLLSRAFPDHSNVYSGTRSWYAARPEVRIVGTVDGKTIAHLGLLRRFLRGLESNSNILVGDTGLVAIDPNYQNSGIGSLLLKQNSQLLANLNIPFGLLTCLPELVKFYKANGWQLLDGQKIRMVNADFLVQNSDSIPMIMPIANNEDSWPTDQILDRNGQEV